jgi:hypothetical protein
MADLFPKPFPNANVRATVPPAIQEARRAYRNHFIPDSFLQLFWRRRQWSYGHPLASEFRSFRQFAGSGTRHLQPHQAVEPTVPELGMLILGAAVYITQTSKGDDRSPCHPSSTRVDNCEVPILPADAKFGLVQIARAGMVLIRESGCN